MIADRLRSSANTRAKDQGDAVSDGDVRPVFPSLDVQGQDARHRVISLSEDSVTTPPPSQRGQLGSGVRPRRLFAAMI